MSATSKKKRFFQIAAVVLIVGLIGGVYYWFKPPPPKRRLSQEMVVSGVGLHVAWNNEAHKYQVNRIYPNSPAEKLGLSPGLLLNKIGDNLAETNNLTGISRLLRGPVGSKITVELIDTNGVTNQVELVREQFINHSKREGDQ